MLVECHPTETWSAARRSPAQSPSLIWKSNSELAIERSYLVYAKIHAYICDNPCDGTWMASMDLHTDNLEDGGEMYCPSLPRSPLFTSISAPPSTRDHLGSPVEYEVTAVRASERKASSSGTAIWLTVIVAKDGSLVCVGSAIKTIHCVSQDSVDPAPLSWSQEMTRTVGTMPEQRNGANINRVFRIDSSRTGL
ncbi:hypothetical protein BV25DRAFT_1424794 [Artomyces pyxidatus]|uniref:Uncharacterized protein n=1 Tax=Artomyces pyxidatus TaxID=48021 RepID=A0ACB8TEA7_9AGAM|nr:hypothetical protein BV25DRAFT_1424794 [Artomyces pyxidatus]